MPAKKRLAPVRPLPQLEAEYRRRLLRLIDQMERSLLYWLRAAHRKVEPEVATLMAADDSPAMILRTEMRRLVRRWQRTFDDASGELATYFVVSAAKRSDAALGSILRRAGISVRWRMTRAMNDVLRATVGENVALIKSIGQEQLTRVETAVMRSVQTGRNLATLTDELQQSFGVTRRRAILIARDQNNKATASLLRVRQAEAGITEAIWVHSGGGKSPRPSHVKAGRERVRYSVADGWFDPHEKRFILPGELINCRCVSRPVVQGFS
jgi:uncharacterized protein with gpF-like domain